MAKAQVQVSAIENFDLNRPDVPVGSHPIETDDYQIPTNEIVKLFSSVCRWIQLRTTGATIYGRPRLGKTWMIKYLVKNIPVFFKENIPMFHIVSLHSKIAKEEEFIETILLDMEHEFALVGKLNAKRQRLIHFLTELAKKNSRRLVVLFIDEAQCLDEQHYEWLIDYFNKLEKLQITLTVFLVGQEQLNSQKTIFSRGNTDQIIQRFMIDEHQFSGLKSVEDIRACLICYDSGSEYPTGSGWSFTRYYFPEAYAMGERLEKFADEIFNIFTVLRQKNNIKGKFEIPMQHMVKALKIIFLDYGKNSSKFEQWISKNHWMEAILKSNYISSEKRKRIKQDN